MICCEVFDDFQNTMISTNEITEEGSIHNMGISEKIIEEFEKSYNNFLSPGMDQQVKLEFIWQQMCLKIFFLMICSISVFLFFPLYL